MTVYNIIEKGTEEGTSKLIKLYDFVRKGSYLVTFQHLNPQSDEKSYRATYFLKLQFVADQTGHTKSEMHEIIKHHLIEKLFQKESVSKGSLTLEEWVGLLQAIDLWVFQNYEIIIP